MAIPVLMPALSPTMETGNLISWLKKEGDLVKAGDILAEIETDKATMEVEAVEEGILAQILVPAGTSQVPVNQPIALIASEAQSVEQARAEGVTTMAMPPVSSHPVSPQRVSQPALFKTPASSPSRLFASPLAKRLAKQAGLDLSSLKGTGPHGRIIERDVRQALTSGSRMGAPAPSLGGGMSDDLIRKFFTPGTYEEVPHDSMRLTIARRLTEAKQTIPHFYLTIDCEIDALLALRAEVNETAPRQEDGPLFKLSVNDFVIKAFARALAQVPQANVTFTQGSMLKHKNVDVGVAVAIEGGLITPIVRGADGKPLSTLSQEMKDLAARARAKKLKPEEYQGGTATISNLGMYGVKNFSAIINPPHAMILAVGAGESRVMVRDGQPVVATLMSVTLSTDHRAVDGALGAEVLAAFKQGMESPVGLLL